VFVLQLSLSVYVIIDEWKYGYRGAFFMSQQELVPDPQDQEQQGAGSQGIEAEYYRQQAHKSNDGPKEDHPSTFENEIPSYSYPAQDRVTYTREQARQENARAGYRSPDQTTRRQVPPWARPQRNIGKKILFWLLAVLVIVGLIKVLPVLIVIIVSILGLAILAVLLPVLIILGLVAAVVIVALISLAMMGITIHRDGIRIRRRGKV
jgi:hypothetical protein